MAPARGNSLSTKPIKAKPQPSPVPQPGTAVTTDGRLVPQATSGATQSVKAVKPAPHLKPFGGQVDPPTPNFISVDTKVASLIPQLAIRRFYECLHKYAGINTFFLGDKSECKARAIRTHGVLIQEEIRWVKYKGMSITNPSTSQYSWAISTWPVCLSPSVCLLF